MITKTEILKKYKISKAKLDALLKENNVTPIEEKQIELKSMVYLSSYQVTAKYYQLSVIQDILKHT